jgi:hypothetical protein
MILHGADPGIVKGDKSDLVAINKAAEGSGVFDVLKKYEDAKTERKVLDDKAEKAYRKYRTARLELLQKKVKTDRAVKKTRDEMETAIDAITPAAEKTHSALKALSGVFIFYY